MSKDLSGYKFLFCDLDGTLIKTVSGKTFPTDVTDFRIRKDVVDKIRSMARRGFLEYVFIVSNQGGIPRYVSSRDFLAKQRAVVTFVEDYTGCFVASSFCVSTDPSDRMRKPNTGMLENKVGEDDKPLCLMIGDASGKEGDFSDSDRKCAENFDIDYMDVEDFVRMEV